MANADLPTRHEAIHVLEAGRARIEELLDRLPSKEMTTQGLGGGTWSPKDLIGHLASWEEYALDALAAWERDERAPIDELQFTLSTSRINDQAVQRKAGWSVARVRRDAERTHRELVEAVAGMSDARWNAPTTTRGRKPLGARVGAIVGGAHLFDHDASHLKSLAAFVQRHASAARPGA
ncbi:MAG TPA: DinB family protein [Actinomycetota bacterium]|nr:DinB family protein [Actinomycetota bacterium]